MNGCGIIVRIEDKKHELAMFKCPECGGPLAVAQKLRRRAIGFDLRQSQVDLTLKRLARIATPLFPNGPSLARPGLAANQPEDAEVGE
jgi:hypothetical protein